MEKSLKEVIYKSLAIAQGSQLPEKLEQQIREYIANRAQSLIKDFTKQYQEKLVKFILSL